MKKILFYLFLSIVLVFTGCNSNKQEKNESANQALKKLNSSEYKLLLNPEKFDDYKSAIEKYWLIVQEVAKNEGIPVIPSEEPLKYKHKQISFFDTPGFELRKAGFLLRQKAKYKDGELKPGYEYGLKYRQNKPEDALSVDLSLSVDQTSKFGEIELESDIVYYSAASGAEETTYSVSNSVDVDTQHAMKLSTFAALFPVLGKLGIAPDTELKKVGGISPDEWMIAPGKLDFGDGLQGRMDITIWILNSNSGQLKIPEFSFDHPYKTDQKWDDAAMQKCTSFIHKLYEAYPDWVVPGDLKAAYLFKLEQ